MQVIPPIKNDSNLIRFANQRHIDENNGDFLVSAFSMRYSEDYLSFDWAQFHKFNSLDENIKYSIISILNRFYKENDKLKQKYNDKKYFAVIDIKSLINKISDFDIEKIKLIDNDNSHTSIYYSRDNNDKIAVILLEIANKNR